MFAGANYKAGFFPLRAIRQRRHGKQPIESFELGSLITPHVLKKMLPQANVQSMSELGLAIARLLFYYIEDGWPAAAWLHFIEYHVPGPHKSAEGFGS